MRLLRDLWVTSPRRTAVVACLIVLGAGGRVVASAVAGPVLVRRSTALFIVLAAALLAAAVSNLVVDLTTAGLTADWAADVRCRLCRVALGQDLPTLETTPVGELLDRIDGDVYQVAAELRGHGVRIAHASAMGVLSIVIACVVWWPAGLAMLVLAALLAVGLSGPTRKISPARMGEEEAWSDLAAVMEESIHGQDDVRTSLARPYVLRLYARRASRVLARGRVVWARSAGSGPWPWAGSTAAGSPPSGCSHSHSAGLSNRSAGWCRSCSTPSAPGVGCSCSEPRGRSRPAELPRPTATSPSAASASVIGRTGRTGRTAGGGQRCAMCT